MLSTDLWEHNAANESYRKETRVYKDSSRENLVTETSKIPATIYSWCYERTRTKLAPNFMGVDASLAS